MNRRPLVAGALAALAFAATGLLSACSAGQVAQTAEVRPGVDGLNPRNYQSPDGGRFYVRNVAVAYPGPDGYPAGSDAPLQLWLFNDTKETVTLVGVGGPAQVVQSEGANSNAPCSVPRSLPPAAPLTSAPTTPAPAPAKSAGAKPAPPSPVHSASPSPSASPTPGSAKIEIAVPAGSCVELTQRAANYLQIAGLPNAVDNAGTIPVWFTFRKGKDETFPIGTAAQPLEVPIAEPESPLPRVS